MVILVDGATDSAKGVVAVGHGVRDREFLQAAGAGGLDDAHVCDIVGSHSVETDLKLGSFTAFNIVRAKDVVSDRVLAGFVFAGKSFGVFNNRLTV